MPEEELQSFHDRLRDNEAEWYAMFEEAVSYGERRLATEIARRMGRLGHPRWSEANAQL